MKRPVAEDRIAGQLMKLGQTRLRADEADVHVEIDEDIMIPLSEINSMRRRACEALMEKQRRKSRESRNPIAPEIMDEIINAEELGSEDAVQRVLASGVEGIPSVLNVTKGQLDEYIRTHFDEIVEDVHESGILIGNLGWAKQLMDAGVKVYGDYGLNAYNGQSVKAYEELGIEMRCMSHEMYNEEAAPDRRFISDAGSRFGGRIPLMITEHPFDTEYLIDRKGVKHDILKCDAARVTVHSRS